MGKIEQALKVLDDLNGLNRKPTSAVRVCTVARDGARMANCGNGITRPIYIGAIYEAKERKSDGVMTWRRVGSFGDTNTYLSDRYINSLKDQAPYRWVEYARHGERALKTQLVPPAEYYGNEI